jgi:hypothetical protein
VTGSHEAVVLSGATADSYNDIDNPDAVRPDTVSLAFTDGVASVPAHSVVICTIDASSARDNDAFEWGRGSSGIWTRAVEA